MEYFAGFQLFKSSLIQVVCYGNCLASFKNVKICSEIYWIDLEMVQGKLSLFLAI